MIAIKLWLRIEDVKKLKGKYKDNEAIEFSFDLNKDFPEDVAQEMVESGYVCEGDHKTMAKAIKDRVSLIQTKREQRQLVREELEKRNLKQQALQAAEALRSPQQSQLPPQPQPVAPAQPPIAQTEKEDPEMDQHQQQQHNIPATQQQQGQAQAQAPYPSPSPQQQLNAYQQQNMPLPPPPCHRGRSMSVCVPYFSSTPPALSCLPNRPSTPPPMLSAPHSPCRGSDDGDTFAGRLSKALESVLPLHSTPPRPRQQRRASLPALFASPVC
ncbi:unnamed protein product, partial [Coregonus sp. 'balchen']